MDLFYRLSDDAKKLLHLNPVLDNITEMNKLQNERRQNKLTLVETIQSLDKSDISKGWVRNFPKKNVTYYGVTNPFQRQWVRIKTAKRFKNIRTGMFVRVPPENALDPELNAPGRAYIVTGYSEAGAYASAFTLVVYCGQLAVIKSAGDDSAGDDDVIYKEILFEIVTQEYLFEQLEKKKVEEPVYKCIRVPEIFFTQRSKRYTIDICMHRAKGEQLRNFAGTRLKVALAHVCKALWHLQRDFHFMHRDLSGSNVFFDYASKEVTFIDFGMSCLNPAPVKDDA